MPPERRPTLSDCEYRRVISAYHDGELDDRRTAAVEAHLRGCMACRRELEQLSALSAWLGSQRLPVLSDRALRRLRGSRAGHPDGRLVRTAWRLSATAAAVLLVCSVLLWRQRHVESRPSAPPAAWQALALAATSDELEIVTGGSERAPRAAVEDADVQLARAIVGLPSLANVYDYE